MKKFPIIITVLLTLLWFYICWYWHTCQIKGFCYVEKLDGEIALEIPNETTDTQEEITPPPLEEIQTTESEETMTQTGTLQENQETLPSNEEVSLQKQECEDIITQAISL